MTEQTDFITGESDPKDFTVDQVNAHLADADEAERERVLALETGPDGKDRSTVKAPESEPDTNAPQTVQEAGETQTHLEGEKYRKGYDGYVPSRDGDNPEDLTLAGVLKRQNQGA
jgi:hypothetical protein